MLLFVFVAMAGGVATAAVTAPYGLLAALLGAPLGGSLCAAAAALVVLWRAGPAVPSEVDLDAQADAMVADLRGLAAEARRRHEAPPERRGAGRHVA